MITELQTLGQVLAGSVGWQTLDVTQQQVVIEQATQHSLLPLLYHTVQPDFTNTLWNAEIRQQIMRQKGRSLLLNKHMQEVQKALEGIPVIWLKGAALAHTVYAEPWLRPMRDLDFLVPRKWHENALGQLIEAGYTLIEGYLLNGHSIPPSSALYRGHHHILVKQGIAVELHYDLSFRLKLGLSDSLLDYVWHHTQEVQTSIGTFRILEPELHFVIMAAHDVWQHQYIRNFLEDIPDYQAYRTVDANLLRNHVSFDDTKLWAYAEYLGMCSAVQVALKQISCFFEQSTIHSSVLEDRNMADIVQLYQDQLMSRRIHAVSGMLQTLPLRDKWHYLIKGVLFLPSESMRTLYGLRPDQSVFPYYLLRFLQKSKQILYTFG